MERVYVQAKRYAADNTVGRPAARLRRGAARNGAASGVLITTSRFSGDSVTFAAGIRSRVMLIDADRFGRLMVGHRVGVRQRQVIPLIDVDEDFFE